MDISDKAKVVCAALDKLGAVNKDNKVTSYAILDYIIEESEELQTHELLTDIPEDDYMTITLEVNLKSVTAILTSLARKNIIIKTEPTNITVDGTTRNLRQYFLQK